MCAIALLPSSLLQNTPYDCSTFSFFSKRREDNSDESIKESLLFCIRLCPNRPCLRPTTPNYPIFFTRKTHTPDSSSSSSIRFVPPFVVVQTALLSRQTRSLSPFPFRSSNKRGHSFSKKRENHHLTSPPFTSSPLIFPPSPLPF